MATTGEPSAPDPRNLAHELQTKFDPRAENYVFDGRTVEFPDRVFAAVFIWARMREYNASESRWESSTAHPKGVIGVVDFFAPTSEGPSMRITTAESAFLPGYQPASHNFFIQVHLFLRGRFPTRWNEPGERKRVAYSQLSAEEQRYVLCAPSHCTGTFDPRGMPARAIPGGGEADLGRLQQDLLRAYTLSERARP